MKEEHFIDNWHRSIVLALLFLFAGQVIWLIGSQSLAYDEPAHTMSGALYIKMGYFQGGWDTPPLGQLIVGLPYGLGLSHYDPVTAEPPYAGRYMSLILGILLIMGIYPFSLYLFGRRAALFSLAMASLSPNILAYSSVSTTDMSVTALPFFAVPCIVWGEKKGWLAYFLAGISLGFGLAAKYSALLACAVVPWLVFYPRPEGWKGLRKRLLQFLLITVAAWFAFSATFLFEGCFTAKDDIKNSTIVSIVAPILPTHAAKGLDNQFGFAKGGRVTYLLGQWSSEGFSYYYPAIIAMKTPLGTILLFLLMVYWAVTGKEKVIPALWYPPLAYLLIITIFNKEQTGLRHILIAYPFIFVALGFLAKQKRLALFVLLLNTITCLVSFPFHLSYVNTIGSSLAQLTESGPFISAGPDVDWGQDENYVLDYLSSLKANDNIWVNPRPRHVPRLGYVATNAETMYRPSRFLEQGGYDWLTPLKPKARFGGWLIYHVEAADYVQLASKEVARWSYQELLLRVLYWQKRWPEVLLLSQKLEKLHPQAIAWRARIELLMGKPDKSLKSFSELEKIKGPTVGMAASWHELAKALADERWARSLRLAYMLDQEFTQKLRKELAKKLEQNESEDVLVARTMAAIEDGQPDKAYHYILKLEKMKRLPPSIAGLALSCRAYVEMGRRKSLEAEVNAGYHLIQIGMGDKGFEHTVSLHRKDPHNFEVIRVMNIFHLSRKVGLLSYDTGGKLLFDYASPKSGQWIKGRPSSGR